MLNKLWMVAAATGAVLAGSSAKPAQAHGYYYPQGGYYGPAVEQVGYHPDRPWDARAFWQGAPESPRERIQVLQYRIDRSYSDGRINPRQARRLSWELDQIRQLDRRMGYDGRFGWRNRGMIQARLDQVSRELHWMRPDGW